MDRSDPSSLTARGVLRPAAEGRRTLNAPRATTE
jgi:hypothetical protein